MSGLYYELSAARDSHARVACSMLLGGLDRSARAHAAQAETYGRAVILLLHGSSDPWIAR